MRKITLLLALALAPATAAALEPLLTLTLDQAVQMGLERNLDVDTARLDADLLHSRYLQAIGAAVPNITINGNYTRNFEKPLAFFDGAKFQAGETNSVLGGVALEQPLYSGGKLVHGLKYAKAAEESRRQQWEQTRDDVAFSVKELFYSVLLASATVGIEQDNLDSTEEHLRTIQERFKMGLDSDLIVLRQEVEVANAKPAFIAASNQVDLGLTLLKETLALDVDREVVLVGELEPPRPELPSYEKAESLALDRRPELIAARKQEEAALEFIRVAAADGNPSLSLFANFNWVAQSDDFNFAPASRNGSEAAGGLNLSYPLFSGGQIHQEIRQARLQYEQAQDAEQRVERAVKVDVKRQWLNVREALERAQAQEASIGQGRRALESTELRYKAGHAGQLDLTDATLALNRARTNYILALNDYWVGLAALERAVGADLKEIQP